MSELASAKSIPFFIDGRHRIDEWEVASVMRGNVR
jgi:hypothetical protein